MKWGGGPVGASTHVFNTISSFGDSNDGALKTYFPDSEKIYTHY